MSKIKPLVCFDMDNTLLKSDKIHIEAFVKAFLKHRLKKPCRRELAKHLTGEPAELIVKNIYPNLKPKEIKQIVEEHDDFVAKETYIYAKSIMGVDQALKEIKKHFTLVLISNCKKKEIKPILKGAKINHKYFKKIIGHDEVKHSKPSPDMIFKAARLTHHKAKCIVGDSVLDIKAGKKAKIKTIAVTTGHHSKKELSKADKVVKDITKVPSILKELFQK